MSVQFARAMYDFDGTRSDTLSFKKDDVITVLKQDVGGWWQGSTLDGRIGIFPKNYVEINDVRDSYEVAVAEYTFESDKAGDLTFEEGDEIVVLKHLSEEWWRGRITQRNKPAREGIFPAAYVRLTGELDYEAADEEAARWSEIEAKARATGNEMMKRRLEAEAELEAERLKLEEANKKAAEARAQSEAEAQKTRDAKRDADLEAARLAEKEIHMAREAAEKRHELARKTLVSAKLQEDASLQQIREAANVAEKKKEEAKKKKKEEDDRFMDPLASAAVTAAPVRKPLTAADAKKPADRFAGLGGGSKCPKCNTTVGFADKCKGPGDVVYHNKCLRCSACDKQLATGQFNENKLQPYCSVCYARAFGPKGFGFGGSVAADDGAGFGRDRPVAQGAIDDGSLFNIKKT